MTFFGCGEDVTRGFMGDSNEPHSQCGTKRTCLRGNGRNIFWWCDRGIPTRVIVREFRCFTTLPCSYIKCGILTMWKPLLRIFPRFFLVLRTILIEFVLNLRKFLSPLAWKSSSDSSGHFYVFLSFSHLLCPLAMTDFYYVSWRTLEPQLLQSASWNFFKKRVNL